MSGYRWPAAALLLTAAMAARADTIWVEGESATARKVVKHPWYDVVKKDGMSGGEWLSHFDAEKTGTATYNFNADKAGPHTFWWRGNPFGTKVAYKLNDAKPVEMELADKRGEYLISDTPDIRFLAWVKVGKVELRKGKNTIAFAFHSDNSHHGGLDCFLLDDTGFVPSGTLKPGPSSGVGGQVAASTPAGPEDAIWVEGEGATTRSVSKNGWYDDVKKDGMSGGEWVSHYDQGRSGKVTYKFNVITPDDYTFWVRCNPFKAGLAYRLNGGKPSEVEFADKRGEYMVSKTPDHRFLAWVKVGKLKLAKGPNTVEFAFHGELANHGGIDCFCLSRIPWFPSGIDRPNAATTPNAGPGDWFPVVFDDDNFSPNSVIDMSRLVEAPAGGKGFLRRDGSTLKFEKGAAPVQFWGVGANLQAGRFTRAQLTQRARYLRKHGVDMVRQHSVQEELGPLVDGRLDPKALDEFDWWCAELKKQGIHMTWSVFYGLRVAPSHGYDPDLFRELDLVDPAKQLRNASGLVNVEPALQDLERKYLEVLMTHKNPYTGLRPVDDPSLAVVEFQNEDTVFFHAPLGDLAKGQKWPLHSRRLRRRFFEWARGKYPSEAALKAAWGGPIAGDDWAAGELGLMGAYHLGSDGPLYEMQGKTRRAGDMIRFLAEMQRGYYDRREAELRKMGYKAVTVTTAWRSGGPAADPANLWADTAADMIDRHNYFGGGDGGHQIKEGKVDNASHLAKPGTGLLSMGLYQVEDRPFASTEWSQLPPNRWKLEAAPLVAFYGMGLQGWDASYHFLNSLQRLGDGWPGLGSYVTDTPHYIGQFPALAFAVKRRHVKEAPIAAARRLQTADLFRGDDPLKQDFTGGGYDAKALKGPTGTPVEALAVGRVTVGFDGGKSSTVDLAKYWDRSKRVVKSMTGELTWDYGAEVVTLSAPKSQAIVGKAGGRRFDLPGVSAEVTTPFVSLLFTPLDDLPLVDSKQVLVTAMARDVQANAKYSPDGNTLLQAGGPPLLMEPVQATLTLKGAPPKVVNVLDVYGVPTGKTVPVGKDGAFKLSGLYRTYYYEIKR